MVDKRTIIVATKGATIVDAALKIPMVEMNLARVSRVETLRFNLTMENQYNPSPERLRDWLSNPKSNGYEALHTTVMGPQGKWVEVQIRTKRMNEIAEKGLAAHWKYKEGKDDESRFDKWFHQIREALSNQDSNSLDFLQDFKTSFLAEEIYVYTPKGDVKMLPIGATALDFAFSVHTAVGSKCIGAKVNHKLVPISYKLRNGDQIEIITSAKQKPNSEWLKFVVTSKAKAKIKDTLKEEKRAVAEEGKYILQRKLEGINAVVVGVMWAATLYLLNGIPLKGFNQVSIVSLAVIAGTFLLLRYTKIPAPIVVLACLLLGWIFQ